ncbi:MAG TPA: oxidoreductase-like domain-containing protein [Caulobacteraceae bacterium]|jgi:hypothetical protein|nr:oxidoreductase-like domain-containing protein [Caulobacteraceae bacterium]
MATPVPIPPSAPRPPDKPDPLECCGRGCCPCIFDYYEDALARWEASVRKLGLDPAEVLKAFDAETRR